MENKSDVGKVRFRCMALPAAFLPSLAPLLPLAQVDEIFGTIQEQFFSVKPAEGMTAPSFKAGDKLYINPEKLLPVQRFLPGASGGGGGKGGGKGEL